MKVKYRQSIEVFALSMENKLIKKDYKGGWSKLTNIELLILLKEEIEELEIALINSKPEGIMEETVDVANYAMMLFDNAETKLTQKEVANTIIGELSVKLDKCFICEKETLYGMIEHITICDKCYYKYITYDPEILDKINDEKKEKTLLIKLPPLLKFHRIK